MKVIRKDRETEKIDAEGSGKLFQVLLDPDFAMIEVLSRDRIIAHQEATANSPIVNMNNRDLKSITSVLAIRTTASPSEAQASATST